MSWFNACPAGKKDVDNKTSTHNYGKEGRRWMCPWWKWMRREEWRKQKCHSHPCPSSVTVLLHFNRIGSILLPISSSLRSDTTAVVPFVHWIFFHDFFTRILFHCCDCFIQVPMIDDLIMGRKEWEERNGKKGMGRKRFLKSENNWEEDKKRTKNSAISWKNIFDFSFPCVKYSSHRLVCVQIWNLNSERSKEVKSKQREREIQKNSESESRRTPVVFSQLYFFPLSDFVLFHLVSLWSLLKCTVYNKE